MSTADGAPFVSVIVPVWNDRHRLVVLLEALMAQSYTESSYEVIVVDNGSTDGSDTAAAAYAVTVLTESAVRGSYAARNRGIEAAKGSIIAFTDSDCIPIPDWVGNGVDALDKQHADLVGGRVRFFFSPRKTGAELFDSISNMQVEENVRSRSVAITANLFVRAAVFQQVGLFPANVQSGGDLTWTKLASSSGHRLVYAPDAVVAHPARGLNDLVRKQYRVGKGQVATRATSAQRPVKVIKGAIGTILYAESPGRLRSRLEAYGELVRGSRLARVWLAGMTARIVTATGNLVSLIRARGLRRDP